MFYQEATGALTSQSVDDSVYDFGQDNNVPWSSRHQHLSATDYDSDKQRRSHKTHITNGNISETRGNESGRRRKRHVGPHDEGGLQRLISTGNVLQQLSIQGVAR